MNHSQIVQDDVRELISRIGSDHLVVDDSSGTPSILATSFALPTLAERGEIQSALLIANTLLEGRDSDGGWDDPYQTIIALEAFTGLKLRTVEVKDVDDLLRRTVRVLRDQARLQPVELELRLARSLVLAGLALQDPQVIDAGMMRARSVLDRGMIWSDDIGNQLHGLLALADLSMVTQDVGTADIVNSQLESFGLTDTADWTEGQPVEYLARAGIILEKMGKRETANQLYLKSVEAEDATKLTTIALKHRIELGARLLQIDEAADHANVPNKTAPVEEAVKPIESAQETTKTDALIVEELPSLQPGHEEQPQVSVLIVQLEDSKPVEATLAAVRRQAVNQCEIIVVADNTLVLSPVPEQETITLIQVPVSASSGRRLSLALDAATSDWIWIIPAGVQPVEDTLQSMIVASADAEVIHMSAYNGQVSKAMGDLRVQPTIRPEHLLIQRAVLSRRSRASNWRGNRPWWPLIAENLLDRTWSEVIHPDHDATDAGAHDLQPDLALLEEMPAFYRSIPSRSPEERKRRKVILDERRAEVYAEARTNNQPVASVLLTGQTEQDVFLRTMQSVIENTETIPFEVIAVLEPTLAKELGAALDRLGVLLIETEQQLVRPDQLALAVEKAQGRYLVTLDTAVEVHAGWLPALVHAASEESAGIVGSFLQQESGKVDHAGIAFNQKGEPVRLHYGKTALLKSLYQRRLFQAVDGDFALLKRSWWDRVGGFDPNVPEAFSFVDLSLRARYKGCRVAYEPSARGTLLRERSLETVPDEWSTLHIGKVKPDLQAYTRLDGYNVEESEGTSRTIPMGRSVPSRKRGEESDMNAHSSGSGDVSSDNIASNKTPTLNELLSKAETLIKDGRFDVAEDSLIKARQQVNGNVHSRVMYWTLLGDARFRLNKTDEAYSCYRKAVSDDPSAERAWIGIGTYHLVKDELDAADQIFSKVVELNPGNMRGHLGKGNVELRRGNTVEALGSFVKASELDPGYRPAIVGLVAAAVQAEEMSQAEPPLERYLAIHPEDFEARFHLAAVLFGKRETDRARVEAVRVLETKPEHKGARELLAHLPGEPSVS
ncbi:tetratricopeptide repeat protein [bacterium]|nr:tetratricopeptide repeat protein [bacterium]